MRTLLPARTLIVAAIPCLLAMPGDNRQEIPTTPQLERVQPELFSASGAQPNAWADYDNDGDLDLFVGFRYRANRLYRNDGRTFTEVAAQVGLADTVETRAAAWGDFDGDGDFDLFVGFAARAQGRAKLYRNDDGGRRFTDVAVQYGIALEGTTRQPAWIDYDQDGDVDLFVAYRDQANRLLRNDGTRFTDVTEQTRIGDPRKTVGVAWFDMDQDGDLDAFVANQDGDQDGFFRNDGGKFTDIAPQLGMSWGGRPADQGSVGPAIADYDNDGDLDLFVATYGPDVLWQNQGDGTFKLVSRGTALAGDYHSTTAAWGDYDNDGWPDLFVSSYLADQAEVPDHLFHNERGTFVNATPASILERGGSHGVVWADFDADGDLDLALANNHRDGAHHLYRNTLPPDRARRSLQVRVVDDRGRWMHPGAEVRLYDAATGGRIGTGLVDSGGGYCSQGATPVHFGLPEGTSRVRVEVTAFRGGKRVTTVVDNVDPAAHRGRALEVRIP
ncbi:MAG: CRTAC1 family protein [Gemmatimonadetes bacterium]|nr:CRTAC1 family protein [Gemmatimonadota bacterium]